MNINSAIRATAFEYCLLQVRIQKCSVAAISKSFNISRNAVYNAIWREEEPIISYYNRYKDLRAKASKLTPMALSIKYSCNSSVISKIYSEVKAEYFATILK